MAKKINSSRTFTSSEGDLIPVIQNGVEKHISKKDLLSALKESFSRLSTDVTSVKKQVTRKTVDKDAPFFKKPISAAEPSSSKHLTTKKYVDNSLHNVLKNDGSTQLNKNLSYRTAPASFKNNDIVTKKFVDDELKSTLKAVKKYATISEYPQASSGDSFVITRESNVFAGDGPEIQAGDLIVCIENSIGGTHSQVGDQFAILNTNVVFSTEEKAGILKVATDEDLMSMSSESSAITPLKLKRAFEKNSEYNRTRVDTDAYTLVEEEKGIIGVNTVNHSVILTLPSIGRLSNAKIVKYLIKDEGNNASKNTITIVASGGDNIQGARTYLMNTNAASIKLYNDGQGKWYSESNVSSAGDSNQGVKTYVTNNTVSGEQVTATGAYESVMSIDVDLREYPIGTGFKVVAHCLAASNGNTKTVAIGVDGNQVLPSSLTTTTAPSGAFIHHELTVLHSDTPNTIGFGFVMVGVDLDAVACGADNSLVINWDEKITVSVDVNLATATTDVSVYALQVLPLK